MISTNTVQPKRKTSEDKYLREAVDPRSGAMTLISSIPRRPITTDHAKAKPVSAFTVRTDFPGVNKVPLQKPTRTFFQTQDMRDIAKENARVRGPVTPEPAAPEAEKPRRQMGKKSIGRKRTAKKS